MGTGETKRVPKDQGHRFERDFGHGKKDLSTVFVRTLAFLPGNAVAAASTGEGSPPRAGPFLDRVLEDREAPHVRVAFPPPGLSP